MKNNNCRPLSCSVLLSIHCGGGPGGRAAVRFNFEFVMRSKFKFNSVGSIIHIDYVAS